MYLYQITNIKSGSIYIGVTKTTVMQRFSSHKNAAMRGVKSALYDAMRSYGIDCFIIHTLNIFENEDLMLLTEERTIRYIKAAGISNYNIKNGGSKVFGIRDKAAWIEKLKEARIGRKPASGMKHSEKNKELFSEYGKLRWDIHGRYPKDIITYSFKEANKLFGISKTHYYRLRNQTGKE
jgi:group I intron endonuclease